MTNQQINIEIEIQELQWTVVEKQRFVKLWPRLIPEVKNFFYNEVFSFGSEFIAEDINNALESLLAAQDEAKRGNVGPCLNILEISYDNPDFDLGRYVVPFLGWLRAIAHSSGHNDLLLAINNFDLLVLNELSQEETLRILEDNLAFFISKIDILEQYKWYLNNKAGFNSVWIKNCAKSLEKNSELLGRVNITLILSGEEKKVEQTIKNWLIDYNSSEHPNLEIQKRGGYEQINYINHSQNVRILSKEEKDVLMVILKFYDWLKFENQEKGFQNDSEQNLPYLNKQKFELFKGATKSLPPVVPAPKGRGERREMDEIDRNVGSRKSDKLESWKSDNAGVGTLTSSFAKATEDKPTLSHPSSNADSSARYGAWRERGENINNESNFAKATSDLKKTVSGEAADLGTDKNQFRGQGGGGLPQAAVAPVRKILNQEDAYVPRGNRVNIQDILKSKEQEARNKSHGEGFGLKMGDGGGGNDNSKKTVNPLSNKLPEKQSGVSKQEEIDRKLEELEKRIK